MATASPPALAGQSPATASRRWTAWNDPQGRITLNYPSDWRTVALTDSSEVFEIESGDGVHLSIYAAKAQGDAMSGVTGYQNRQNARTDRVYRFAEPTPTFVGGQPAVSDDFISVSTSYPPDEHTGQVLYVVAGLRTFAFEFYTDGMAMLHTDQMRAILQSVAFPGI